MVAFHYKASSQPLRQLLMPNCLYISDIVPFVHSRIHISNAQLDKHIISSGMAKLPIPTSRYLMLSGSTEGRRRALEPSYCKPPAGDDALFGLRGRASSTIGLISSKASLLICVRLTNSIFSRLSIAHALMSSTL